MNGLAMQPLSQHRYHLQLPHQRFSAWVITPGDSWPCLGTFSVVTLKDGCVCGHLVWLVRDCPGPVKECLPKVGSAQVQKTGVRGEENSSSVSGPESCLGAFHEGEGINSLPGWVSSG